jgi:DNA-binding beta-propeller fold protein YncE
MARIAVVVLAVAVGAWFALPGDAASRPPDLVWGTRGVRPGDLARPRAAAFDGDGRLWIVDFTARVQAFDADGRHLGVTFTPPDFRNGRPSGLGTDNQGRLIVCDSHYHRVRVYSPDGTELLTLGDPAKLGYVSDCVQDADGFWYVSEFGDRDRITKLAPDGTPVTSWGESGGGPGQLNRVRALALGPDGLLYAADACNHRVQVFERDGRWVRAFGGPGAGPGEFRYPYDLAFGPGGELYVVERGNARVQKLTADGTPLAAWGRPGRGAGELSDPWAVAVDREGRVHVIDTENHRVQRVRF